MTLCLMRIACWVTKAPPTHTERVIFIAFPLQQWLRERVSILRYTYVDSLFFLLCHHVASDMITSDS
jgi:hypothetical protein